MAAHILIAEDENHTRLGLSLILRKAGYRVSLAEDGLTALRFLRRAADEGPPVDLFLTDVQMPGLTGLELLDAMKREGLLIPTVTITGYGDKEMVVSLMRRGCQDYLDKPFTPEDVHRCIEGILAKQEENRDTLQNRDMERLRLDLESRQREMSSARQAHAALTRPPRPFQNLKICFVQHAYAEMGGDFLDFRETDQHCDILLADVAGHDMGASYHTVMLKAFFEDQPSRKGESLFKALNAHLSSSGNDRMITALFLRVNLEESCMAICNAAHPSPVLLDMESGSCRTLQAAGDSIGLWPDAEFPEKNHPLVPGSRILMFTDGVSQAKRIDGPTGRRESLGEKRIMDLAVKHRKKELEDFLSAIWKDIMDFCRSKPSDDMLMVALEIPSGL
ncbi:DNA-binding NtrC family response regulator [Desulfobotulus alkaliphilus]|uniref:DNA-binding NtrC family response regulator n=1 Tax=Desulfobotulus alkaliphilus TaxID=622671 RepID=A0A562R6X8_9BACT|nr:response regulator [Desulfobotulus alkaliphilus]TWI64839.1 DNA-binding NtrC family response regulator [Desulfobotulus alkaliphilus]